MTDPREVIERSGMAVKPFSASFLGYPVTEQGPCVSCREPTRRYGEAGDPMCGECHPEPRVIPRTQVPLPRASEPELEPSL